MPWLPALPRPQEPHPALEARGPQEQATTNRRFTPTFERGCVFQKLNFPLSDPLSRLNRFPALLADYPILFAGINEYPTQARREERITAVICHTRMPAMHRGTCHRRTLGGPVIFAGMVNVTKRQGGNKGWWGYTDCMWFNNARSHHCVVRPEEHSESASRQKVTPLNLGDRQSG